MQSSSKIPTWSNQETYVASRKAHNLEIAGSNPAVGIHYTGMPEQSNGAGLDPVAHRSYAGANPASRILGAKQNGDTPHLQ